MPDQEALYPIREISRLTGVTPITLRAWERRYDLIEPVRTESGHRLYTKSHVDFINQAVELTKQGIPISKVKSVIEERKEAKKSASNAIDIDFESEILKACHNYNFNEVQLLVEQLFVNSLELQVRQVIVNVTLALVHSDDAAKALWQSVVVPILSTRTYQGRKLLRRNNKKNAYIIAQQEHPVLQQLVANQTIACDYNPVVGVSNEKLGLIETLQKLHCEALVIVSSEYSASMVEKWAEWASNHKSVEVFLINGQGNDKLHSTSLNFKVCSYTDVKLF